MDAAEVTATIEARRSGHVTTPTGVTEVLRRLGVDEHVCQLRLGVPRPPAGIAQRRTPDRRRLNDVARPDNELDPIERKHRAWFSPKYCVICGARSTAISARGLSVCARHVNSPTRQARYGRLTGELLTEEYLVVPHWMWQWHVGAEPTSVCETCGGRTNRILFRNGERVGHFCEQVTHRTVLTTTHCVCRLRSRQFMGRSRTGWSSAATNTIARSTRTMRSRSMYHTPPSVSASWRPTRTRGTAHCRARPAARANLLRLLPFCHSGGALLLVEIRRRWAGRCVGLREPEYRRSSRGQSRIPDRAAGRRHGRSRAAAGRGGRGFWFACLPMRRRRGRHRRSRARRAPNAAACSVTGMRIAETTAAPRKKTARRSIS